MRRALVVLAAVLAAMTITLTGTPTWALEKTIAMSAFKATTHDSLFYQTPASIKVMSYWVGSYSGWAPVTLPVGATIEKVTYYHWIESPGNSCCFLMRVKPTQNANTLASTFQSDVTTGYVPQEVPFSPGADLVVRKGYIYYVQISMYRGGAVSGIKIQYHLPAE